MFACENRSRSANIYHSDSTLRIAFTIPAAKGQAGTSPNVSSADGTQRMPSDALEILHHAITAFFVAAGILARTARAGGESNRERSLLDIPRLVSKLGDMIGVGEFYGGIYNATPAHLAGSRQDHSLLEMTFPAGRWNASHAASSTALNGRKAFVTKRPVYVSLYLSPWLQSVDEQLSAFLAGCCLAGLVNPTRECRHWMNSKFEVELSPSTTIALANSQTDPRRVA